METLRVELEPGHFFRYASELDKVTDPIFRSGQITHRCCLNIRIQNISH